MKKFEYQTKIKMIHEVKDHLTLNKVLNEQGQGGWELISTIIGYASHDQQQISNYTFIFKREKDEK